VQRECRRARVIVQRTDANLGYRAFLHTEVGCLCPSRALGERAKLLDAFVFQGRKVFARHAGSSHQTKSTGQPQTLSRTLGNRSSCRYLPPRLFHRHCRRDRGPRKQRVALRPGHH
jgi:hypothetical protein